MTSELKGPASYDQFFEWLTSCSCDDDSDIKCDSTFHRKIDRTKGIVKEDTYWDRWEIDYCKWFLQNDPIWSTILKPESIQPFYDWGYGLLDVSSQRVDGSDNGIDLVAEGFNGDLWGIQAKCYLPHNEIHRKEVDSFLAVLNIPHNPRQGTGPEVRFDRGLFMTTSKVANSAMRIIKLQPDRNVTVVSTENFDRYGLDWSYAIKPDVPVPQQKKWTPLDHQKAALKDIKEAWTTTDRGIAVMACGTGKTLVGLWAAEDVESQRSLVLLPSLNLVSQVAGEWLKQCNTPITPLFVCSDGSISTNAREIARTTDSFLKIDELGFSVTNKPEEVCRFLNGKSDQHRVVFSTYQSSEIIELAHKLGAPEFDIAVADEAHHCAGVKQAQIVGDESISNFARILYKDRIHCKKRLFMTATPRKVSDSLKRMSRNSNDDVQELFEVASMDEDADFGPKVHVLNFGEAIRPVKGRIPETLLSDYQIVVFGTTENTKEKIDKRVLAALVNQFGDRVNTDHEQIANLCGMLLAIQEYNLDHMITYHNTVASAKELADDLKNMVSAFPTDIEESEINIEVVHADQTTKQRADILKNYRESTDGINILTNARCLTEGVDVKAVDSVAFFAPKWSTIDIIQAVGRCIRKNGDDKVGTILIPVFFTPEMIAEYETESEATNEVLLGSNYRYIWQVLQAIKEHDEVLEDELNEWRREKGKRFRASSRSGPAKIHFDIFDDVLKDSDFLSSFQTRILELSTSNFEEGFGALEAYKKENGHLRVRHNYKAKEGTPDELALGAWVNSRRVEYNSKTPVLSQERINRLNEIGFIWDALEEDFQIGIEELIEYKQKYGHLRVERNYKVKEGTPDEFTLGTWVNHRRAEYKETGDKRLSEEKINRLNEIGFIWDIVEENFQRVIKELITYKKENGHLRVKRNYKVKEGTPDELNLGNWVNSRRVEYKETGDKRLSEEKINRLNEIGFIWDINEENFLRAIKELMAYKKENGDLRVKRNYKVKENTEDELALGAWVSSRRMEYNSNNPVLTQERINRLNEIGFIWDPKKE